MSTPQAVIVDDRNTQVLTYSGNWHQNPRVGIYKEYNTTTSEPFALGVNVSFPFNGTSVSVYATLGVDGSTCEYVLDNDTPVISNTPPLNTSLRHNQVYSKNNLVDGPHTLTITVTELPNPYRGWFLDYIIYTPSNTSTSLRQGESFFFDDTDPAFQYSGSWSTGDGTNNDMQSTLHGALSQDSSVSLQFIGTYVDVYGRLPSSNSITAVAQFVIDGGSPYIAPYPPTADVTFDSTTMASSNYRLYHNPYLPPGSHLMVITPLANHVLWLDYVTAGTGPDTSNPQPSSGGPGPPNSSPPSPLPSQKINTSSLQKSLIAGVTVGSVILLTLLAGGIFMWFRWKRKHRQIIDQPDLMGDTDTPAMTHLALDDVGNIPPITPFLQTRQSIPPDPGVVPSEHPRPFSTLHPTSPIEPSAKRRTNTRGRGLTPPIPENLPLEDLPPEDLPPRYSSSDI